MLSDTVLIGVLTAIPTTLAALGALIVSIRNGKKNDEIKAKVEAVDEKAIEIHTLTNSNLSKVTSQLEVANSKLEDFARAQGVSDKKIESLEKLVAKLVPAPAVPPKKGVER